jgi:hypothetical protein
MKTNKSGHLSGRAASTVLKDFCVSGIILLLVSSRLPDRLEKICRAILRNDRLPLRIYSDSILS